MYLLYYSFQNRPTCRLGILCSHRAETPLRSHFFKKKRSPSRAGSGSGPIASDSRAAGSGLDARTVASSLTRSLTAGIFLSCRVKNLKNFSSYPSRDQNYHIETCPFFTQLFFKAIFMVKSIYIINKIITMERRNNKCE